MRRTVFALLFFLASASTCLADELFIAACSDNTCRFVLQNPGFYGEVVVMDGLAVSETYYSMTQREITAWRRKCQQLYRLTGMYAMPFQWPDE